MHRWPGTNEYIRKTGLKFTATFVIAQLHLGCIAVPITDTIDYSDDSGFEKDAVGQYTMRCDS